MKKLIFILPLLYYSCTDDIVSDINALQTENAEQDAQIGSLLTIITDQQEYMDSLNTVQNTLNATQQAYIDSLNGVQQTLIDALILTAPSTGENYVRIESVQICWDKVDVSFSGTQFTFPQPFIEIPYITAYCNNGNSLVTDITTTNVTLQVNLFAGATVEYHAIGKWK